MSRDAEALLRERAKALARPETPPPLDPVALTLFRRASQTYGVRLEEVSAGGLLRQLTVIPGGPPWLLGALHHRGEVLSLLDLPALWGTAPARGVRDLPSFIVVAHGGRRIGIAVEELYGVHEVEGGLVPYAGEARSGLESVGRQGERAVLVLSASHLLSDARLGA